MNKKIIIDDLYRAMAKINSVAMINEKTYKMFKEEQIKELKSVLFFKNNYIEDNQCIVIEDENLKKNLIQNCMDICLNK